jgi:hypothetical protein
MTFLPNSSPVSFWLGRRHDHTLFHFVKVIVTTAHPIEVLHVIDLVSTTVVDLYWRLPFPMLIFDQTS